MTQSINELKSYTEYNVSTPTSVFTIGFQYDYNVDHVNVYVDGVEATAAGYTVQHDSQGTITLTPTVPTGVVRLVRETDIDSSAHTFSAGAKFTAGNMDENFEQIRHSQQEVRDGFSKLSDDTYATIDTLQDVGQAAQDAADAAEQAAITANDAAAQVNDKVSQSAIDYIHENGAALPYNVGTTYEENAVVVKDGELQQWKGGVWVQLNSADSILDTSGKTQQEINNITAAKVKSVLDYGAIPSIDIASDNAFAAAISALKDGDTLSIDGDFYLEKDWIIDKEINLDVRGNVYLNNEADSTKQNSIIFRQSIAHVATGADLTQLPKKGDTQLYLSIALKNTLGNLSQYCITLESTEILTNRLGFTLPYYKNEYNHIVSNEGHLAANLDINYTDASALKINFIRKQRLRTVNNLIPKIKGLTTTTRKFLVQQLNTNNMIFNSCGIEKSKGSTGEGWAVTRSGLNTYNQPIAINTNASGGDADAFSLYINGFNTFNQPRHISSDDTATLKFFSGRHGKKNKVTGLQGALDEHWGYDLIVEDTDIMSNSVISWAGGNLTLRNVNRSAQFSQDPLVMLRADTPTADGDLVFEDCNIKGAAFYATRSSLEPTKAIRRKSFDRIILRNSTLEDFGYQMIGIRGYTGVNDTREKTELIIDNVTYTRQADAANQYGLINNQIISGWNVFSKVTLNNVVPKVIGIDTGAYYLLRYMQTDVLDVINCPNISMQNPIIGRGKIIGGSVGTSAGGIFEVDVKDKLDFIGTTFNEDMPSMAVSSGLIDKIGYVGCTFNTDRPLANTSLLNAISNTFGNVYGNNISATLYSQIIDITNYTNPNRRKQLYSSTTLSSPITIAAGAKSAARVASTVGARLGDFVKVAVAINADIIVSGRVSANNAVTYYIKNDSATELVIPTGTTINIVVSKI